MPEQPVVPNDRMVLRGLYDARVKARELVQVIEEIVDVEAEAVRIRTERAVHDGVSGLAAPSVALVGGVGLFLFLAGSWGIAPVHALNEPGTVVMPDQQQTTPEAGLAAMRAGDHRGAIPLLRAAAAAGHDPDLCLGRLAECQFRIGELDEALFTCTQLESKNPSSHWAPYVRGLVLKKRGDKEGARYSFNTAAVRGHPLAEAQLRTIK